MKRYLKENSRDGQMFDIVGVHSKTEDNPEGTTQVFGSVHIDWFTDGEVARLEGFKELEINGVMDYD